MAPRFSRNPKHSATIPVANEERLSNDSTANFRIGQEVELYGLQKRSEANGMTGTIINYSSEKDRFTIQLDNKSGSTCLIKAINLKPRRTSHFLAKEDFDEYIYIDDPYNNVFQFEASNECVQYVPPTDEDTVYQEQSFVDSILSSILACSSPSVLPSAVTTAY